jgi:serine/threonine-protein kinase RsbW
MRYEVGDPASELTFTGPAGPESLEHVHQLIQQLWDQEPGVPTTDRYLFATALVELLTNIIQHGGREDGDLADLVLRLSVDADRIQAVLLDDGVAAQVDVNAVLPDGRAESGRGLPVARTALDELDYERDGMLNRWDLGLRRSDSSAD